MKRILLLSIVMVAVVFTSCNKNQKIVKKLDGRWILTAVNGVTPKENDVETFRFSNCKLKKYEYCDITIEDHEGKLEYLDYRVGNEGEEMFIKYLDIDDEPFEIIYEINELTSKKLKMILSLNGVTSINEYDKK